tara:strand:+ start:882 stop:1139 length:258 start_codon:yes stop_codon:yes gene_type:complete
MKAKTKKSLSKKELLKALDLNKQILELIPEIDSMYFIYKNMDQRLQERYETYDQFAVNPYSSHKCQIKYNSDEELGLGEYTINEK